MDECDISDERIALMQADALRRVQLQAAAFDPGAPGECEKCGEDMPRLVNGWCCPCRDKFKK